MWADLDKVPLSEDHYECFFYWPLLHWISRHFNKTNSSSYEDMVVLKPSRYLEGKQYHSDLVVYGEYPFLLQYKPPEKTKNTKALKYTLTSDKQHNALVDIAKTYSGVFVCYALPIIPEQPLRLPHNNKKYPYCYYDLEKYLWFVDISSLPKHKGQHHIKIDTSGKVPKATLHSEPKEIKLISMKEWLERLSEFKGESESIAKIFKYIKEKYPRQIKATNLLLNFRRNKNINTEN